MKRKIEVILRTSAFFAVSATVWLAARAAEPAGLLPIEDFVKEREFGSIQFSPDGSRFAALVERDGRTVLTVVDYATNKGRSFAPDRGLDVESFRWLTNDLISARSVRLGVRQYDLTLNDFQRTYVSVEGKSRMSQWKASRALRPVPGSGSDVIVGTVNGINAIDLEVIDANTGDRKRVLIDKPPGPRIEHWVLDDKLDPLAGTGYNVTTHKREIWARDSATAPWVRLLAYDPSVERGYVPVAIDSQGDLLVLSNQASGRNALYKLDRSSKQPGELLVGHAAFDIDTDDLIFSDASTAPVGVSIDAEMPEIYWFDPVRASRQRTVDASLPAGRVNRLTNLRNGKVLVYSYGDTEPGTYYFYDPQAKTLSEWVRTRPWIRPELMSRMDVVHYRARDGQDLFGYFTRPVSAAPGPVPLLVWVHGGPHARDHWGFDPDIQFFASRGYAVFQPSFRGSTGMGERFETAGYRQWGRMMQDDVTDGVRALIDQGRVDPRRVCIGGGSYGGYAALMGVIREPDLFRCAIDEAGPTDMIDFLDSPVADYNRRTATFADGEMEQALARRIGDPSDPQQRRDLEENSPRRLAARIKAPVLLVYGTDDQRVPFDQGTSMRDALRTAGARFEWKSYIGEGHGVWDRNNRLDRLRRMERFLGEHLGANRLAQ